LPSFSQVIDWVDLSSFVVLLLSFTIRLAFLSRAWSGWGSNYRAPLV
jgi:hypothetical protein